MGVERRRATRLSLRQEEVAVIHDKDLDRLGTLIDISSSGALVFLTHVSGAVEFQGEVNDLLDISLQSDKSFFHIQGRLIRKGNQFVAIEFVDERAEVLENIDAKLQRLEVLRRAPGAE